MGTGLTAPCQILEWDSRFFGFPIARVLGDTLTTASIQHINLWCRQNGVQCLYFLATPNEFSTTTLAEANDFHLVDMRVTLARDIPAKAPARCTDGSEIAIRNARQKDIPALGLIAEDAYPDTRFFHDPHFPTPLSRSLYRTWIEASCTGYADAVLVSEFDQQIAGYISCHLEVPHSARIGLVGVAKHMRGYGIGQRLVNGAMAWFEGQGVHQVTVVTQGRNIAAQHLYQRCGFLTQSVQLWYHKWYSAQGGDNAIPNPI